LRDYRGADGASELYEVAGDSYRYEKGDRSVIGIRWNEATKTLGFAAREPRAPRCYPTSSAPPPWPPQSSSSLSTLRRST